MSSRGWKVVQTDNFNRDTSSEAWLVERGGLTEDQAKRIADIFNENANDVSDFWAKAVPPDYKLYIFEP